MTGTSPPSCLHLDNRLYIFFFSYIKLLIFSVRLLLKMRWHKVYLWGSREEIWKQNKSGMTSIYKVSMFTGLYKREALKVNRFRFFKFVRIFLISLIFSNERIEESSHLMFKSSRLGHAGRTFSKISIANLLFFPSCASHSSENSDLGVEMIRWVTVGMQPGVSSTVLDWLNC